MSNDPFWDEGDPFGESPSPPAQFQQAPQQAPPSPPSQGSEPSNKLKMVAVLVAVIVVIAILIGGAFFIKGLASGDDSEPVARAQTTKAVEDSAQGNSSPKELDSDKDSTNNSSNNRTDGTDDGQPAKIDPSKIKYSDVTTADGVISGKYIDVSDGQIRYWLGLKIKGHSVIRWDVTKSVFDSYSSDDPVEVSYRTDQDNRIAVVSVD